MKKAGTGPAWMRGCHLVGGGAGGTEPGLGSDELREELRMLVGGCLGLVGDREEPDR